MTERQGWKWVALVTVLGLILRSINLNGGLWVDEMYSLVESFRIPFGEALTSFPGDTHHPLYAVVTNLLVDLLGDANWVIRLPAMLAGVATIPLVYRLGVRFVAPMEALAASLLLACSYHHVWFSQNARGYTIIAMLTVLTTDLLLEIMEKRRTRTIVAYAVAMGLGAYTHLTMVFGAFAHAFVILGAQVFPDAEGRRFRTWLKPGLALVASAGVTILLYSLILGDVLDFFLNRPSRLRGISTPAWAIGEMGRVLSTGVGAGPGLMVGAGLFGIGLLSYLRRHPLAFALFVTPGFVTIAGALAARGTMYPRFFFFLIGFAMLILARGVMVVTTWAAQRVGAGQNQGGKADSKGLRWGLIVSVLAAAVFVRSLGYNYAYPKQDWTGAAAWLDEHVPAGETVITAGVSVWPFEEYLPRPFTPIENGEGDRVDELRHSGPVWMVYVFPRYLEATHPRLFAALPAECVEQSKFDGTLGDGDIFVCRFAPAP